MSTPCTADNVDPAPAPVVVEVEHGDLAPTDLCGGNCTQSERCVAFQNKQEEITWGLCCSLYAPGNCH